jgi:hypothetical protein
LKKNPRVPTKRNKKVQQEEEKISFPVRYRKNTAKTPR